MPPRTRGLPSDTSMSPRPLQAVWRSPKLRAWFAASRSFGLFLPPGRRLGGTGTSGGNAIKAGPTLLDSRPTQRVRRRFRPSRQRELHRNPRDALPHSIGRRGLGTVPGEREERMPRSPDGCRGQATSSCSQGIRRILQPSTATAGDWAGGFLRGSSPTQLGRGEKGSSPFPSSMDSTMTTGTMCEPKVPDNLGQGFRPAQGFSAITPTLR